MMQAVWKHWFKLTEGAIKLDLCYYMFSYNEEDDQDDPHLEEQHGPIKDEEASNVLEEEASPEHTLPTQTPEDLSQNGYGYYNL
eukprot:3038636-Amphidinium_carterae.1